jgi:hypothetical protein
MHCMGAYEMLMDIHAALEDVEGSLRSGQLQVTLYSARETLLRTTAIRALGRDGELGGGDDDHLYDPFAGLSEDQVTQSLLILRAFHRAGTVEEMQEAYERLRAYVRETEVLLGFTAPLASIRTPQGLFPALRVAREVVRLADQADLPSVFPANWTPAAGEDDLHGTASARNEDV